MTTDRIEGTAPTRWFPEQNEVDFPNKALPELLEEAWESIKHEMETNHSSQALIDLRKDYGNKLKSWWASKRTIILESTHDPADLRNGKTIKLGDEEITLVLLGDRDDDQILNITHKTPISDNKLTVSISEERGVDTFLRPPTITSKIRDKPHGNWITTWEVVFKGNAISTITRIRMHDHPEYQLPYVKQIEIIDASIFGVDTQGG